MNLKELQAFIKFVSKSGVSEVSLEKDDFKVTVKTGKGEAVLGNQQPVQQPVQQWLLISLLHLLLIPLLHLLRMNSPTALQLSHP